MSSYTFTDIHGNDYAITTVALESRDNLTTERHGDKWSIKALEPCRSTWGDVIAPRPCFPIASGLGPDCPLQGILHGGAIYLPCYLFCVRPAPDGCVVYHVLDERTYDALGGALGRGTEWPVPSLPFVPRAKVVKGDLPRGLFDENGRFKLPGSFN